MCGIATFFARESVPDYKHLDTLFEWSEKRGGDGFGLYIDNRDGSPSVTFHCVDPYSKCKDVVKKTVRQHIKVGSLIIVISRAAPETEIQTSKQNLQPIINNDCVVAHNGAVSNKIHLELKEWANDSKDYQFYTEIDSEAIIAAYVRFERNMKDAMEYLSGGFAAIFYDKIKDMLYTVNDFKPIAHGYVKGLGFFLASDNDALREVIFDYTGCSRDGVNMWECYYAHYLSGGRIKQIDLQSGFIQNIKYSPRYIIGDRWDSNNPKQ